MSIAQNLLARLFQPLVDQRVRAQLSVLETENAFLVGTRRYDESPRDRISPDRQSVLEACLTAWREDPLARRLVGLTSQYVVGGGVDIQCDHQPTMDFLTAFWGHRLNRMSTRVIDLCEELSRSGNLFLLISTDRAGMSYLRVVPPTCGWYRRRTLTASCRLRMILSSPSPSSPNRRLFIPPMIPRRTN